MDRICQYSTIIFASNVSVLLIVSVITDYWEYRGFEQDKIEAKVKESNTTTLIDPDDTNSYLQIRYYWDPRARTQTIPPSAKTTTHYQPPALVYKYFYEQNYTVNITYFDGFDNITKELTERRTHRWQDTIILYVHYGNLFRECDSLEAGVRSRLGFVFVNPRRCFNFVTTLRNGDYIYRELPAIIHLERSAFTFAIICIISSIVSVVGGAYGSLAKDKESVLTASTSALISGVTLTISIALFHGKCHLLHRREFMAGVEIPYKKIIDQHRTHQFGWSFVLAWICVVLCFIHTWVWLRKSQDMEVRYSISRRHRLRHKLDWSGYHDDTAILDL